MSNVPAGYRSIRIRALAPDRDFDVVFPCGSGKGGHWYQFCNEVDEGLWTSVSMFGAKRCGLVDGKTVWCWVMINYYDRLRGPIVFETKNYTPEQIARMLDKWHVQR